MNEMKCPKCGSTNTYRSKKFNAWICEDCDEKFSMPINAEWNSGLQSSEFWCAEFCQYAPCSLSHSYGQLMHYVAEGNIGCTLFLIRDVFELMIKIPTVILFDSIYSLLENIDDFKPQFDKEPKLEALYRNSMQMLSTGKWWECVRLGAGLSMDSINLNGLDEHRSAVLSDTISYLKQVYKLFEFRVPGKQKVNMVTWRNRAVGHSCLASKPEESYPEIPYILKMFKKISEISLPFYRKVCFANGNKDLLIGMNSSVNVEQVFIAYEINEGYHYFKIHDFVAGRKDSMSYYDGYEKGKAYLLDYGDGDRYKDTVLSKFIMSAKSELDNKMAVFDNASPENINEDNLETADIQQLEARLSIENQVFHVDYLYQWLMRQMKMNTSGVFVLQSERGMGKSTFCKTIDQLSKAEIVRWFSDDLDGWTEFMDETAIRVWHFNSTYYGRKDIYLKGIGDALLTLESGYMQNGVWVEPNRLVGNLDSIWGSLNECAEDLRKLYFAEAINLTATEYFKRTNKNKLLLVLDGLDEIPDSKTILSFIPSSEELNSNVYILITCRTEDELESELAESIAGRQYTSTLVFKRNSIAEHGPSECVVEKNETYSCAIELYVKNSIENLKTSMQVNASEIIDHFESRFSELTAYFSLCQMNQRFFTLSNIDLLQAFLEEVRNNSTDAYYSRVLRILKTLAWCGDSLTLRELAFISGEGYVSYRFLGILNDLRAFVKVTRTSRGNCYEFSHNEWEESVKKQFPLGSIEFRMHCSQLLDNVEELYLQNLGDNILSEEYMGELWLLTHIMNIYSRDIVDLQENWFENVRTDIIYNFIQHIQELCERKFECWLQQGSTSSKTCEELKDEWEHCKQIYVESNKKIPFLEILQDCLYIEKNIKQHQQHLSVVNNHKFIIQTALHYAKAPRYDVDNRFRFNCMLKAGDTWNAMGNEQIDSNEKTECYKCALQSYEYALEHYFENNDNNMLIECIYKKGRACEFINMDGKAIQCFEKIFQIYSEIKEDETIGLGTKELICRAYIRYGNVLLKQLTANCDNKSNPLYYYQCADKMADQLIGTDMIQQFVETKIWCIESQAKYYNVIGRIDIAIDYRKAVLKLYEEYRNFNRIWYIKGKRRNLYLLGDLYETSDCLMLSLECYEEIIELDELIDEKPSEGLLENLIRISSKIQDTKRHKKYQTKKEQLYAPMDEEYKKAFQEVYIIYNHMPDELKSKIPQSFLEIVDENRDHNHQLNIDDDENFVYALDDSQLLEKTVVILGLIYRDFLSEDDEQKILQDRDKNSLFVINMREILKVTTRLKTINLVNYSWKEIENHSKFSNACSEVWAILKLLPREIVLRIPLTILMTIKEGRNKQFSYSGKISKINKLSKVILRYLIQVYIPDFETQINIYEKNQNI